MAASSFINPWQVDSLQAFTYLCCPECVYRSQEETSFQAHALQNHPNSLVFYSNKVTIKEEKIENEFGCEMSMYVEDEDDTIPEPIEEDIEDLSFDSTIKEEGVKKDDNVEEELKCENRKLFSQAKYTLQEKHDLAKFVAKCKERYDVKTTRWHKKKKIFVEVSPKGGYISKAIRLYYSDLENLPAKDPVYKKAVTFAVRCFVKFGNSETEEGDSVKKRIKGAGRKKAAPGFRDALYEHLLRSSCGLIGGLPRRTVLDTAKVMYQDWLKNQPEEIPLDRQLKFSNKWVLEWMKEYQVATREDDKARCDLCNQDYKDPRYLIQHYKHVHKELPPGFRDKESFICEHCSDYFTSKQGLYCHVKKKHPKEGDDFDLGGNHLCDECPTTYKQKHHLEKHIERVHRSLPIIKPKKKPPKKIPKKIYQCPRCSEIFTNSFHLGEHIKFKHVITAADQLALYMSSS